MRPESRKLLWEILDSGRFILEQTADGSLARYLDERLFRQAIERNFEIIGEALNILAKEDASTAEGIPEYRSVINLRHRLAHGYRDISDERMWTYITELLPGFVDNVQALFDQAP